MRAPAQRYAPIFGGTAFHPATDDDETKVESEHADGDRCLVGWIMAALAVVN